MPGTATTQAVSPARPRRQWNSDVECVAYRKTGRPPHAAPTAMKLSLLGADAAGSKRGPFSCPRSLEQEADVC